MLNINEIKIVIETILRHFGKRDDFYHVVTGPKREVWFNAEIIAALARSSSGTLEDGLIFHGEQSFKKLLELQGEEPPVDDSCNNIPDITGYSFQSNSMQLIIESKLIDTLEENKEKASISTLIEQVERAKRLFPNATCIGLIYAVHHLSRACPETGAMETRAVAPNRFYAYISKWTEECFNATNCRLVSADKFIPVPNLQLVSPLGGKWNGSVSLGLILFECF